MSNLKMHQVFAKIIQKQGLTDEGAQFWQVKDCGVGMGLEEWEGGKEER